MMTQALTVQRAEMPTIDIVPEGATGNRLSRLKLFSDWLGESGRQWHTPDLAAYRDHLLDRMTPRSAKSHLATIRGRYKDILSDNKTDDLLTALAGLECDARGDDNTPANRQAYVAKALRRLANGTDAKKSAVKVETVQDKTDEEYGIRLTRGQADALLASPGLVPISALRDTCILAVLLCTGVRAAELCNLDVKDLRVKFQGEISIHVREGKGCKTRCVPWGAGAWALRYLDKWLSRAGIVEGPVFRGFYKGHHRMRDGRLSVRAVQKLLTGTQDADGQWSGGYPVMIDGELTRIHVHDCRRTYAKLLYDAGVPVKAISENLGHASIETTVGYIGISDVEDRRPPSVYTPPHWGALDQLADVGAMADLAEQSEIDDGEGAQ